MENKLSDEQWYHGLLSREDIKMMLRSNGDFLVRTTEPMENRPRVHVLSVMVKEELEDEGIKHLVIAFLPSGKVAIERHAFESVSSMIEYYLNTRKSLLKSQEVFLLKPIVRQSWELSYGDVEIAKKLGVGTFGEVHAGKLKLSNGFKITVAVKVVKLEVLTNEQIRKVLNEARLMRQFDHPNVIKFYGVAAEQEPFLTIMELADCGALDIYLRKNEQPMDKKNEMCLQAAWGLEYLHAKNVLHMDIAARNCLYGDNKVKISDFGLAREGTFYQMDPSKRIPIRWLAPETLIWAIYTQKTDVFSYGIMCWEIYNNGMEPYPGLSVTEVNQCVREGYRMELPRNVHPGIQKYVKIRCWSENPNDRYSMAELAKRLERTLRIPRPKFVESPYNCM